MADLILNRASRRKIAAALNVSEAELTKLYLEMVRTKQVSIPELTRALEAGNVSRAVELLSITELEAVAFVESLRATAVAGGFLATNKGINPFTIEASTWLREKGGQLITAFNHHLPEAVNEVLALNASLGRGPRKTANDLAGYVNSATKRREGGLIGVNEPQAKALLNYERKLRDPSAGSIGDYRLRSRRFDAQIARLHAAGEPVPEALIREAKAAYSDNLKRYRGEMIARTEGIEAMNYGRQSAMREAKRYLGENQRLVKIWVAGPNDKRQREEHGNMDGVKAELDEPFVLETGDRMMYPADSSLGASPNMVINCRCSVAYEVITK